MIAAGVARRSAPRARLAGGLLAAGLLAAFWTPGANALPPGGAVGDPGDPPATVAVTASQVAADTAVSFRGSGWLNSRGEPQRFYIKFDDHGNHGIGPYHADAQGNIAGTVQLVPPESATPGQKADYAPADLNTPGTTHWLRFLAGPYQDIPWNGPARSMRATFTVVAPTAPGTPPGGEDTTPPESGSPDSGTPASAAPARPPAVLSSALRPSAGRLSIRVRAGERGGRTTVTVLSARPLRLAPGTPARTLRLAVPVRRVVAPNGTVVVRPALTPAARRLLSLTPAVRVVVRVVPATGRPVVRQMILRR